MFRWLLLITVSIFHLSLSGWERVYLASFPRSGNHWMRYLIEEATHVATSSVYCDLDVPHLPTIFPWLGYCAPNGISGICHYPAENEPVVVKTHYPHHPAWVGDNLEYIKAIYLVRHPIDSLYSYYVYSQNGHLSTPVMPRQTIMGFGHDIRLVDAYWTSKDNVLTLRYEDLYVAPFQVLKKALEFIGYNVTEEDIKRACLKYPPQGAPLKHLSLFSKEDQAYIAEELRDFMNKYDYHIPN